MILIWGLRPAKATRRSTNSPIEACVTRPAEACVFVAPGTDRGRGHSPPYTPFQYSSTMTHTDSRSKAAGRRPQAAGHRSPVAGRPLHFGGSGESPYGGGVIEENVP